MKSVVMSTASSLRGQAAPEPQVRRQMSIFSRRCAECLCCSVFETFAPRPLPFVAPSHAHVNTPNMNNRARSVLLFARFVVVVKKFLDAIVIDVGRARLFLSSSPAPLFFCFLFFCFFVCLKRVEEEKKKMHLVSWYPILILSRATTTRVQKQEMKNSSRRLGSFFFRSAPVAFAALSFLFSLFSLSSSSLSSCSSP